MNALIKLEPGQLFAGDFEVIRPLAEGGMGAVYVARQKSTGYERALKIMLPQFVSDGPSRARFEQESTIGSKIDSDHVVQVVAAGVDEPTGTPWIAMELLRGESLEARVKSRGPLSREVTRELFDQLRHALGAAHARNIVHRDLKPENLFVADSRSHASPFTVKVLDFGISRIVRENQTAATVTTALGSPLWMAPEQAQAGAHIRPSTDVWALGLVAFYVFTAKAYWLRANDPGGINLQALLVEVMVDPIAPPSVRGDALGVAYLLPGGFDGWFSRCVARQPEARFRDAREALDALLPLLAPPTAQPLPTAPPAMNPPPANVFKTVPMEMMSSQPFAVSPLSRPVGPSKPAKPAGISFDLAVPVGLGVLTLGALGVFAWRRNPTPAPSEAVVEAQQVAPREPVPEVVREPPGAVVVRPPETAVFPVPSTPDPRGGVFTLADATEGLGGYGTLVAHIDTDRGELRCTLDDARAPNSVANFVGLARGVRDFWDPIHGQWTREPFYNGSVFHRVIPGFMIQGGDYLRSGLGTTGYEIHDENVNGHNAAGLLCMANSGANHNGGQFFITDAATPHLEGSHSIFGRCTPTELVSRIANTPRSSADRPTDGVLIRGVSITRE